MKYKNRGVLTVEAALVYPVFVLVIVTIISILNLFYVHAVVQQGIANTANIIAEYSHAIKLFDSEFKTLNIYSDMQGKKEEIEASINDLTNKTQTAVNTISKGLSVKNIDPIINDTKSFIASAKNLTASVKLDDLLKYFIASLADDASDIALKAMTEAYLKDMNLNTENIMDMDFSKSKLFYNSPDYDITIVVTYKYKNPFIFNFFGEVDMLQTVTVRPWIGGIKPGLQGVSSETDDNGGTGDGGGVEVSGPGGDSGGGGGGF